MKSYFTKGEHGDDTLGEDIDEAIGSLRVEVLQGMGQMQTGAEMTLLQMSQGRAEMLEGTMEAT